MTVLLVMGALAAILSVVALRTPVAGGVEQEALGALADFTARTRGLAEVDRQREELAVCSTLLALVEGLTGTLDEDVLWTRLVAESRRILETDWAIALRAEDAGMLVVTRVEGLPANAIATLSGARVRAAEIDHFRELLGPDRVLANGTETTGTAERIPGSWLSLPLLRGGWYGGHLLTGYHAGRDGFSRRQLRLAHGIGRHLSVSLQNARLVDGLEAADRVKSEFVATMSHELRTPLSVIIGYAELLRCDGAGQLNSDQGELVQRIEARGRELLELIEATLQVSRIQAGRDPIEVEEVSVGDLARVFEAGTDGLPRPPGVEVHWRIDLPAERRVATDRTKLGLVVRNLVSNALKYTEEGSVDIRIGEEAGQLVIEVRDTGIGISPEHLPLVFDLFRQVDQGPTRRRGGVGLGLYIVEQFCQRLGGRVCVESEVGRGSLFRVLLPLRLSETIVHAA